MQRLSKGLLWSSANVGKLQSSICLVRCYVSFFSPISDIDVMVKFSSEAGWGLFEFVGIQQELETMFGRDVDLPTRNLTDYVLIASRIC